MTNDHSLSLSRYQKAVAAALTGIVGWSTFVVQSAERAISSPEWLLLGGVAVQTFFVYATPNDPPPGAPADPNLSERGSVAPGSLALGILLGVLFVYLLNR